MQCALCSRSINARSAWKGANEQFYCSEFCADSEGTQTVPAVETAAVPVRWKNRAPTLLDHHLSRPYERLERLLPYMRQLSGRAAAGAPRETNRAA
jgi:hypothetical protein